MDDNLFDAALRMPPSERVAFAELILASIDYEEEEIKKSWLLEVKQRMQDITLGKTKLLDFEELYSES